MKTMKNKDSMVYLIFILSIATLALAPGIIDSIYAPDTPVTNVFGTWLEQGENFVNSMVYATGF